MKVTKSPAACGRGLKHASSRPYSPACPVARRVRAWIETSTWPRKPVKGIVARRVRAWIETFFPRNDRRPNRCRPPRAGVD